MRRPPCAAASTTSNLTRNRKGTVVGTAGVHGIRAISRVTDRSGGAISSSHGDPRPRARAVYRSVIRFCHRTGSPVLCSPRESTQRKETSKVVRLELLCVVSRADAGVAVPPTS
jgi:hypothetical protein